MTDKIREIKKAVLRLMLALAIGVLAGAAPGDCGGCRGSGRCRDSFGG